MFFYEIYGLDSHKSLAYLITAANDGEYANEGVREFDFVYEPTTDNMWFAVVFVNKNASMQWRLTVDTPTNSSVYYGDSETDYKEIRKQIYEKKR
jgi:hypothetical protein